MNEKKRANKLCLGTVQFGECYGVNNALGRKPTKGECFRILQKALDLGIECFDTAGAYGNAESLLGEFGASGRHMKVVTKFTPPTGEIASCQMPVKDAIRTSMHNLRLNRLYGYLLHREEDLGNGRFMTELMRAKKDRCIEKVGASVYRPESAVKAVRDERIDILQVPYNVLDQRLDEKGFFSEPGIGRVKVFARSCFLQGLLLMEPERGNERVPGAGKFIERFRGIVQKNGFSPAEGALLFVYSHPGISCILIGVDTVEQLEENVRILERVQEFVECREELIGAFRDVPERIVMPNLWGEGMISV